MVEGIFFPAGKAVIPVDAAMQFQHIAAAGHLVQTINVLRDHGSQSAGFLHFSQFIMGRIGTNVRVYQRCPVKLVE